MSKKTEIVGKFNSELEDKLVPLSELKQDPDNARTHDERNLLAIANSLDAFGQQTPIVCRPDGTILKGNGTLQAAKLLGWTHLAAVRTRLSKGKARAYQIADNRTSDLSTFDVEALVGQLQGLDDLLAMTGFSPEDIQGMAAVFEPSIPEDQGRLDQKAAITCPHCHKEFVPE